MKSIKKLLAVSVVIALMLSIITIMPANAAAGTDELKIDFGAVSEIVLIKGSTTPVSIPVYIAKQNGDPISFNGGGGGLNVDLPTNSGRYTVTIVDGVMLNTTGLALNYSEGDNQVIAYYDAAANYTSAAAAFTVRLTPATINAADTGTIGLSGVSFVADNFDTIATIDSAATVDVKFKTKAEYVSKASIASKTVPYNTAWDVAKTLLPQTVEVTYDAGFKAVHTITWGTAPVDNSGYDPIGEGESYTATGTISNTAVTNSGKDDTNTVDIDLLTNTTVTTTVTIGAQGQKIVTDVTTTPDPIELVFDVQGTNTAPTGGPTGLDTKLKAVDLVVDYSIDGGSPGSDTTIKLDGTIDGTVNWTVPGAYAVEAAIDYPTTPIMINGDPKAPYVTTGFETVPVIIHVNYTATGKGDQFEGNKYQVTKDTTAAMTVNLTGAAAAAYKVVPVYYDSSRIIGAGPAIDVAIGAASVTVPGMASAVKVRLEAVSEMIAFGATDGASASTTIVANPLWIVK